MNITTLTQTLADLPLGPIRYFDTLGSTNVEAITWAKEGAPNLAMVLADEQTAGRGRHGRRWYTPPGAALAFSLILRPQQIPYLNLYTEFPSNLVRLTALGALSVCDGLEAYASLNAKPFLPKIKWPNDVLIAGRKLSGVLVESHWQGDYLTAVILGIGINVAPDSIPPDKQLAFPATCLEEFISKPVNREELLHSILRALLGWHAHLESEDFIQAWEHRLAYRNQLVQVNQANSGQDKEPIIGEILGLTPQGALSLRTPSGKVLTLHSGEVSLRPVDRSIK